MNPVVIIPTYIAARQNADNKSVTTTYDHVTLLNEEGELGRCLSSLDGRPDITQVIVLVASEPAVEKNALEKVQNTVAQFPNLHVAVFGAPEETLLHRRLDQLGYTSLRTEIGLKSYGAIRNFGLLLALLFGFDAVVFLDDDELVTNDEFMTNALHGLGKLTKKGIPVLAKTGYYLDKDNGYLDNDAFQWYNHSWQQADAYNQWIIDAMNGPRLSRSNRVVGGLMAIHKEAFKRVPFDPWLSRGEDMDYMLNLRMYGSDMWFDNQWRVKCLPAPVKGTALKFRQDAYRWLYEFHKLEYSKSQIDLIQVRPESLVPYPGNMLTSNLAQRIRITALLRSLALPDKKAYRTVARTAPKGATTYAQRNCTSYFGFLQVWSQITSSIEDDTVLIKALSMSVAQHAAMVKGATAGFAPVSTSSASPVSASSVSGPSSSMPTSMPSPASSASPSAFPRTYGAAAPRQGYGAYDGQPLS